MKILVESGNLLYAWEGDDVVVTMTTNEHTDLRSIVKIGRAHV